MNKKLCFTLIIIVILSFCSYIFIKQNHFTKSTNNINYYTKNDSLLINMGYTLVDYIPTEQEKANGIFSTEKAFIESVRKCPSNTSKTDDEIRNYVEQSYQEIIKFLKSQKN